MVFDPVEQARAKRALVMVLIATVIVASIEFWINYIWNPTTNVPSEALEAFNKLLTLVRAIAYPVLVAAGIYAAIKLVTCD
mgnify:FL=1